MKRILQTFIAFIFLSSTAKSQEPVIDWQRNMTLWGPSTLYNIQKSPDDSLFLPGFVDVGFSNYPHAALMLATDSLGTIKWDAAGWPSENSYYYNVIPMADHQPICGGYEISNTLGLANVLIEKAANQWTRTWRVKLGGSSDDRAFDIIKTNDNDIAFAGFTYSIDGNVTGNHGNGDMWIGKLDMAGNLLWQKCLGGT